MTITPVSIISAALGAVAGRIRVARVRGAQRIALMSLLEMDPHRLDDLGLDVHDVRNALAARGHRA